MSLSQPSHTIVVEPLTATTPAPAPKQTPPDDREKPAEVAAKA